MENKLSLIQKFDKVLEMNEKTISSLLPETIKYEKYIAVIKTAISSNPELLSADQQSLFNACKLSAQDGLLPNKKDAAFVIFNKKNGNVWEQHVQYMPMISGIIKKLSPVILDLQCNLVYENDEFDYELGDSPAIKHRPTLTQRGNLLGCYCILKTKDGGLYRNYMSVEDIKRRQAISKSQNIWTTWFEEMAKKTVIRNTLKRVPLPEDIDEVVSREDNMFDTTSEVVETRSERADKFNVLLEGGEDEQVPVDVGNPVAVTGTEKVSEENSI